MVILSQKQNIYNEKNYWIGQVLTYSLVTGALPYTFISDTNALLVVKIEPIFEKNEKNEIIINKRPRVKMIFFPLFILTDLSDDQIHKYQSDKHENYCHQQTIVFSKHTELKEVRNPLSSVIGALILENVSSKKYFGKKFHTTDVKTSFKNAR